MSSVTRKAGDALPIATRALPDATSGSAAARALELARVTVLARMTVEVQVLRDLSALRAIEPEWRALAAGGGSGALFRGPDWVVPWWHAYHQVLGAELHVLAGRENGEP